MKLLPASFVFLLIIIVIAFCFFNLSPILIAGSIWRGTQIATDILFIVFGAILFLEILRKKGVINSLAFHLDNFSPDTRLQVIMLAWFLENFIEGIAGFGTPATIAAPLLVSLGLSPFTALIISLLGNSTSVPFGAVGTPIRVGFANLDINYISLGSLSAIYNIVGFMVPVFMLWALLSSVPRRRQLFFSALPFTIWSGVAFVLPSYLVSLFGIEYPSIIGSIIGTILVIATTKFGFLVPSHIYRHSSVEKIDSHPLSIFQSITPYLLFVVILIISKTFLPSNLFNPGYVFIFVSLVFALFSRISFANLFSIFRLAFSKSIEPFLVIAAMSSAVQIMNNSSITSTVASSFTFPGLALVAPFIGAFGSFLTGSATVSNLMFGSSLFSSSLSLGTDPLKILSLALIGAGAGNMVALADVLAAKTVVGSTHHFRQIIFTLLPFCLIYLILVSILGLFI